MPWMRRVALQLPLRSSILFSSVLLSLIGTTLRYCDGSFSAITSRFCDVNGNEEICSHLREAVICSSDSLSGVYVMRRVSIHEEKGSSQPCEEVEEA